MSRHHNPCPCGRGPKRRESTRCRLCADDARQAQAVVTMAARTSPPKRSRPAGWALGRLREALRDGDAMAVAVYLRQYAAARGRDWGHRI